MPKDKRNLPHVNATLYQQQDETIRAMLQSAGPSYSYSRILREIVHFALQRGYTPGSVSVRDMIRVAHEHGSKRSKPQ